MKRNLLSLFLTYAALSTFAQDTIQLYLDKNYNTTTDIEAVYIRTIIKEQNKIITLDKSLDNLTVGYNEMKIGQELILHGYSEFYRKPGVLYSAGQYFDGFMKGEWKYHLGPNADSVVDVNYDAALTFLDDEICPRIMRKAKFANKRTGVNEIELIVSIKEFVKNNVIIPGPFVNDFMNEIYRLDFVMDIDGAIQCPVFVSDESLGSDLILEAYRTLAMYNTSERPTHPLRLSIPFYAQNIIELQPDTIPQFPGGQNAMMAFLGQNLKYPHQARDKGIQGPVYVTLIVGEDGVLKNISILQSPHPLLSEEALRVVKLFPPWIPAVVEGKAVEVQISFPVMFKISGL